MTVIAEELGVPTVPFSTWLEALEDLDRKARDDPELVLHNPALRLLSFFRAAQVGDEWEPIGVAKLDLQRALRVSGTLRAQTESLSEHEVCTWLASWKRTGFLL